MSADYEARAQSFIDWYDDRSGSSGTAFDGVEKRRLAAQFLDVAEEAREATLGKYRARVRNVCDLADKQGDEEYEHGQREGWRRCGDACVREQSRLKRLEEGKYICERVRDNYEEPSE